MFLVPVSKIDLPDTAEKDNYSRYSPGGKSSNLVFPLPVTIGRLAVPFYTVDNCRLALRLVLDVHARLLLIPYFLTQEPTLE